MKRMFLLILVMTALSGHAQKAPIKFGDVNVEELKMTKYNKDSSASAVVLTDFGISEITYSQSSGFDLHFDRIRRVKILTKDGYEFGNFSITLYKNNSDEEKLGSLKAVTYNLENGKIVETKMKNDAVFHEKGDGNYEIVKFALPNVKEGSVIEIAYHVTSPFLFNFQDWDFQSTIPIKWSEYRVRIPEYFRYKKWMQGYLAMTVNESSINMKAITLTQNTRASSTVSNPQAGSVDFQKIDYQEHYNRWAVQDAPAFRIEPYMTTYRDYLSRVNFELSSIRMPGQLDKNFNSTWEELNSQFLDESSFGGVVKGSGFLKEYTEQAIAGKSDTNEKIAAIYSFLKSNMVWDERSRKYASENLRKVFDSKKGSSADINLMLVSMLVKADINAYPVLISTRDHGFIRKENPASQQFNYVIAAVKLNDKFIFLDATDRSLPISILPERCLNNEGLLIQAGQPSWIKIEATKSKSYVNSTLDLTAENSLKGNVQINNDGYYAQNVRKKYASAGKDEYLKNIATSHGWEIGSSEFTNMDKVNEAVVEKYGIEINDYVQVAGDHMYLNPMMLMRVEQNPFQLEQREYPVDFGSPEDRLYIAKITLPDSWTVEEMPKQEVFQLPGGSARFRHSVSLIGNALMITSQLSVNKALFVQDEYQGLRDFYARVVAKHAEQIVLKKK